MVQLNTNVRKALKRIEEMQKKKAKEKAELKKDDDDDF